MAIDTLMVGTGDADLTRVRLGFLPLTDCAPLLVAARLGLGASHGIRLELQRQASWAGLRDRLLSGELDAAHTLYAMVYGVQLGLAGPQADMALLMTLNRNGQAITLSRSLADHFRAERSAGAAFATLGRRPVLAHTFPTGTHAMWLHEWLATQGVDPLRDVDMRVIPPAQMADALANGELDGFCAGEPWHAVASARGIGVTVACTSEVWPNHPEKALACRSDWAALNPDTACALIRTLLDACRWLDEPGNLATAAGWLADEAIVGVPAKMILPRMQGDYGSSPLGGPPCPLSFGGNRPAVEDGEWFLARFARWGLLDGDVDASGISRRVSRVDLFDRAAGVTLPPA
jgi:nitrate/nitrite transport system substrate-binding protein